MSGVIHPLIQYSFMSCLVKNHRGKFTFTSTDSNTIDYHIISCYNPFLTHSYAALKSGLHGGLLPHPYIHAISAGVAQSI